LEINVCYFYPLRDLTGKLKDKVSVDEGATVQDLLNMLSGRYGERFKEYVCSGISRKGLPIIFLLDGRNIIQLKGLRTHLREGCVITMMPPIAGG
jgi:MoaD family protein